MIKFSKKFVTSGADAAGFAIIRLLITFSVQPKNVILTDRQNAIYKGKKGLNPIKEEKSGTLADSLMAQTSSLCY